MRRIATMIAALLLLLSTRPVSGDASANAESRSEWKVGFRESFNTADPGKKLPKNWRPRGTKLLVPPTVFEISDSSGSEKILRVTANRATGNLMTALPADFKLKEYPIMRWRWRVLSLPPGGDCRNPSRDDQPIAIYVATGGLLRERVIAYRWENLTPANYECKLRYLFEVHCIAIRNGTMPLGEWVVEERNVLADFERIYKLVPHNLGLSISANSQYSQSHTVAEIDYIEFVAPSGTERKPAGGDVK
ncbi:MAG: DUF3047 domain-containing protein [Victivallaceae bacterium]|nr:DUF3047 domain-containing protein [Victivallaceae bacterium]